MSLASLHALFGLAVMGRVAGLVKPWGGLRRAPARKPGTMTTTWRKAGDGKLLRISPTREKIVPLPPKEKRRGTISR